MKLSDIKPNPNNPRIIKDDKFDKLVQSLKDFPEMAEVREIVVNKDNIILGGNMRYKAMIEAVWKEAPVRVVDWPEEKQREFIIKDNVSGGDWDWDSLANQWDAVELDAWGLDVPNSFGIEETQEDDAPLVDEAIEPISKLGEVYQLGRHRLMCGDATKVEDVGKLMNGSKADLLHTDPPYNVDYTGKTNDALKIDNDKMDDATFRQFLTDSFTSAVSVMKRGASFYIFHADSEGYNFRGAAKDSGMLIKQCLTWVKNTMVMGRQDYQWKHEPILYGWVDGGSHNWYADRKQTTVINFDKPMRNGEHPTMKPIGLCAYLIGNSSKTDDIVLDTFGGSGSTLIACEQTNRTCYTM